MSALLDALSEPDPAPARVRALVEAELDRGDEELRRKRAGIPDPVTVIVEPGLRAVVPVPATVRADPQEVDERAWLLVAAMVGALVQAGGVAPDVLTAGDLGGHLVLSLPGEDAELAVLAFDDLAERIDRLRVRAVAAPAGALDAARDLRAPVGAAHPLRVAEAIAALGGNPADPAAAAEHEEAVLAQLAPGAAATRPHDDPDPARRVARRILQRLSGMGKWGGYHTEFSHLARGFNGNDKQLAEDVGERLLAAGILLEKPSVGQRHVFLNSRRARDVYALVDDGTVPSDLELN
jgi:hypothetical protein